MAQRAHAAPHEARAPRPAKKRSAAPRRKASAAPRSATHREAQGLGFDQSVTFLNEADFKAFEAAIAEPAKPNAELRETIEHSRRLLKDV